MKISKNIFAFFAAAATMVGCSSSDEIATPSTPGKLIDVTMQASMSAPSTRVDAGFNDDMGLSFTWDADKSDVIDFAAWGDGIVTKLGIESIDNTVNSTATFGGEVVAGSQYRLIVAKNGIEYDEDCIMPELSIANQSVELNDTSIAGFDKNVSDNMFLINNDGLRPVLSFDATEIPSVKFAHINASVVFRVNFAEGALNGVEDYKITKLTLDNVWSDATLYLNEMHTDNSIISPLAADGMITVDVNSDLAVKEGSSVADEYWIPVSVFPGISLSPSDAKAIVWLEGTNANGKKQVGYSVISLYELMKGDYAAGTNNAIKLNVTEVTTLTVEDEDGDTIADGERIIIEVGEEFPFTVEPYEEFSVSSYMSNNDIDCYGTAGSYTIIGMSPSKDDETRVEIKSADGDIVYTFFVTVLPKTTTLEPTQGDDYTDRKPSNCYIVNPMPAAQRVYNFPVEVRVNDYWGNYANVAANKLAGDLTGLTIEQLWSDCNISAGGDGTTDLGVTLIIDKNNKVAMQVVVPAGYTKMGNAVYAVKKNGSVLWSWHLWVTDYHPYDASNSASVGQLDRYIGQKTTSGAAGILLYQFGRKDPFYPYNYSTSTSQGTIQQSVLNPTRFYTGTNWASDIYDNSNWYDKDMTLSGKSIFDPSPYAYRVADKTGNGLLWYTYGFWYNCNYYSNPNRFNINGHVFFTGMGLGTSGNNGYFNERSLVCWTNQSNSSTSAYYMSGWPNMYDSSYGPAFDTEARACALPVLPMFDKSNY